MAPKPTCECGVCAKCARRVKAREKYRSLSKDERRAIVARRDPEKVRAADRARYQRDKDKRRMAMDDYNRRNPEKHLEAARRWRERNPEKRAAQVALGNALRSGWLTRGPCENKGEDCWGRVQAHHDDYSRPLDVRWFCTKHHADHHTEERGLAA